MKFPLLRLRVEVLKRFNASTLQRFVLLSILLGAFSARAQFSPNDTLVARSVSGQFVVTGSPLFSPFFNRPEIVGDADFVRLEPTLLAISADRFKIFLWQQLGVKASSSGRGEIFLNLRPAQSLNDGVTIASASMLQTWSYRVTLPDVLARTRFARAMSAVLLMEIANRNNATDDHTAEIPGWLADGLAQTVLDENGAKIILSTPSKMVGIGSLTPEKNVERIPLSSLDETKRNFDPLTSARIVLQKNSALTFDQLSWPTDAQVNGADGGIYLASAQLFVHELLGLKNGPERMRALLARLPGCLNWQTAFFSAFHDNFQRSLDVEKWWSLRVVKFAAHNSGSSWTDADSNWQLANLLTVPVETRTGSNSLPMHAEVSLQVVIRSFEPLARDDLLQAKLRELELTQFRVSRPFAPLVNDYCATLADFLGERQKPAMVINKHEAAALRKRANIKETLKKLDALDARRRNLSTQLKINLVPRNVKTGAF